MENQIVSCRGMDCSVCSLLEIFQNIFVWLLGITSLVAMLSIIIAGLIYILNLGSRELLFKAKKYATYTLFGFIITLASFISINTVYLLAGITNKNSWFQMECSIDLEKQLTEVQKPRAADLKYEFVRAGSIFSSTSDPQKVTGLDIESLSPQNMLFDSLELLPGQMIRFIVSDKTLRESDIKEYISQEKGFFTPSSGDRGMGTGTEEAIKIVRDGDIIRIVSEGDNPTIIGEFGADDETNKSESFFKQAISLLSDKKNSGKNVYVYNDRNQEEEFNLDETACVESGGEATVFQSECEARKQACGQKNILCTDKESELMGCQCPAGSCLKDQKCVNIENIDEYYSGNDQDNDGTADKMDRCPNTPEGEAINTDKTSADFGCACSQLKLSDRVCPPSRCEGTNLITYPNPGKDTCADGKRTMYSCDPQIQFNQQCQQSANQNFPIPNQPSGGSGQQQQNIADILKNMGQGGGGGSKGGCGNGNCGSSNGTGSNTGTGTSSTDTGSSPDSSTSPSSTASSKPLSAQEAFESGNGTAGSPYEMSEKGMEEAWSYNEKTDKLELDKNWESKLGVAGKDSYVKVPDKEKIMKAVDKKRKEKGQKELTDEQKEKLKNDKDAVKAPKGANVVDKDSNKEQSVDKDSKDDPSKTSDDSLDSDKQLLKARKAGDLNYEPRTAKEKWAAEHGLVKAEDGTFKKKNSGATDYFTPDVAQKLKRASDILKDEYGKDLSLTSGFRGGEGINPNSSRHNSGRAADVALSGEPMTQQNKAILETAMSRAGLRVLRWPSIYEWWHFSDDGH